MAKKSFNPYETPKNAPEFKLNPGSTSILLIFVTLCLVAFAVLCVVSSNSDRKLGNKVIERTGEYYDACNKAQALIASIDDELYEAYEQNKGDVNAFYEAVGGSSRSFVIDIKDDRKLYVELIIDYPITGEAAPLYHITSWHVGTGSPATTGTVNIF